MAHEGSSLLTRRRLLIGGAVATAGIVATGALAYKYRKRLIHGPPPKLPPATMPAPESETAGLPEMPAQPLIDAAKDGDTITLPPGRYVGGIDFGDRANLTIEAAIPGRAFLEAGQVRGGSRITLRGLVIQKVVTPLQVGAVITGPDWVMEDCVVRDNESLGVSVSGPRSILRRVRSLRNGYMGFGCGTEDGNTFEGPQLYDCESAYNNHGRANPIWKDSDPAIRRDGHYYANPAWEAGGGKFCLADGLVIERMHAHHNGGVGIWLDVYNKAATIRDCVSHDNFGIEAGWQGAGFAVEICHGPTLIEGCTAYNNTGSAYAIWEAKNVTIRKSIARDTGIEFRDLDGDRKNAGWFCQNVLLDSVRFEGSRSRVYYWKNQTAQMREKNGIVEQDLIFTR